MLTQANGPEGPAPGTTGRYLVLLREDDIDAGINALSDTVGLSITSVADFDQDAVEGDQQAEADVFDQLTVRVVDTPPEYTQALGAVVAEEDAIVAVEPERRVFILQEGSSGGEGLPVKLPNRACRWRSMNRPILGRQLTHLYRFFFASMKSRKTLEHVYPQKLPRSGYPALSRQFPFDLVGKGATIGFALSIKGGCSN